MKGIVVFDDRSDLAFYSLDKEMERYVKERVKQLEGEAVATSVSAAHEIPWSRIWICTTRVYTVTLSSRFVAQRCTVYTLTQTIIYDLLLIAISHDDDNHWIPNHSCCLSCWSKKQHDILLGEIHFTTTFFSFVQTIASKANDYTHILPAVVSCPAPSIQK